MAFGSPAPSATTASITGGTALSAAPNDHNVAQAGTDGISSLTWSPTSNYLVSSNWDGGVRCWECQESGGQIRAMPKAQVSHEGQAPVLCSAFSPDGTTVFSGGGDKAVRMWNLASSAGGVSPQIGVHASPVKSVAFLSATNLVVSGGWDKMLKFWDARQPNPVGQMELPERIYDISVQKNLMVVATAGRHILSYDVGGGHEPIEVSNKESPLKFQSRCVACFPDMTGFAVGSIEGRVGIHYIQKVAGKESFAFKCHRQESSVFSVNAIAFHPLFGTFSTVGGDGVITFWDKDNKQRLKGFPAIQRPISAAAFNFQGNMFAYASSYDWGKGSQYYAPGTPNEIWIHYTSEDEAKPKGKP